MLGLLTGLPELPLHKHFLGYRHEADKFAAAGLTAEPSHEVKPPRAHECKVQLEAVVRQLACCTASESFMTQLAICGVDMPVVRRDCVAGMPRGAICGFQCKKGMYDDAQLDHTRQTGLCIWRSLPRDGRGICFGRAGTWQWA